MKNIPLLFVLLLAFVVRIVILFRHGINFSMNSDDIAYINSGKELLKSHMLTIHRPNEPTAQIMPLLTFYLAFIMSIFGTGKLGLLVIKILMILMGVLNVFLSYLIGKEIYNKKAGLVGALLFAVSLPHALVNNLVLTETPFTLSLMLYIYYSIKLVKTHKWKYFYLLILFYLVGVYIRPTIAFLPLVMGIYFISKKYPVKLILKQMVIGMFIVVIALCPWWIRNYNDFHTFIPLDGGSGNPMLLGTFQGINYPKGNYNDIVAKTGKETKGETLYYTFKAQKQEALKRIHEWWKEDKISFLKSYLVIKPKIMWKNTFYVIRIYHMNSNLINTIYRAIMGIGIISLFILLGFKKIRKEMFYIIMMLVYFTFLYCIYYAYDRYALPTIPLIFIIIGTAASIFYEYIVKLTTKKQTL